MLLRYVYRKHKNVKSTNKVRIASLYLNNNILGTTFFFICIYMYLKRTLQGRNYQNIKLWMIYILYHHRIKNEILKNNSTSCPSLFLARIASLCSFSFCWCFQNKFPYKKSYLWQMSENKMYFPTCFNRFLDPNYLICCRHFNCLNLFDL